MPVNHREIGLVILGYSLGVAVVGICIALFEAEPAGWVLAAGHLVVGVAVVWRNRPRRRASP